MPSRAKSAIYVLSLTVYHNKTNFAICKTKKLGKPTTVGGIGFAIHVIILVQTHPSHSENLRLNALIFCFGRTVNYCLAHKQDWYVVGTGVHDCPLARIKLKFTLLHPFCWYYIEIFKIFYTTDSRGRLSLQGLCVALTHR